MVLEEVAVYKNSFRDTGWAVVKYYDRIFSFKENQSYSVPKSSKY